MASQQTVAELQDISADLLHLTQVLTELSTHLELDITGLEANHISLRCHQNTTAKRWRRGFKQYDELLSENIINGRPIRLFKLHEPICVQHWQFYIIELPWPNGKRYPRESWKHIEVVLPGEAETLNTRALALLSDHGPSQPGIFVRTNSPKGECEHLPNPTLAVSDDSVTIKFHPWSIETIVASERQE